jgi:hypothetical protein
MPRPQPDSLSARAADQPSPSYLYKLVLLPDNSACMITEREHQDNCATAAAVTNVFEGDTEVVVGKFGTPGRAHVRRGCGAQRRAGDVPRQPEAAGYSKTTSIYGFGCRRGLFRPLPLHPGVGFWSH